MHWSMFLSVCIIRSLWKEGNKSSIGHDHDVGVGVDDDFQRVRKPAFEEYAETYFSVTCWTRNQCDHIWQKFATLAQF